MSAVMNDERGFTLVELLVVVLVIGVLAAIALPMFLGQSDKAKDARAISDVRNAVTQMEICYRTADTYSGCPDAETPIPSGVTVTVAGDGATYTVSESSESGTTFTLARLVRGYEHSCTAPGAGVCTMSNGW
jgi:type IV pilus assembly protein PilA